MGSRSVATVVDALESSPAVCEGSGVHRLTIRVAGDDPRSAELRSDAAAVGLPISGSISVSDVIFVRSEAPFDRVRLLADAIVDPLVHVATWEQPDGEAIEVGMLAGVTDPRADALFVAARTLDIALSGAATAVRYELPELSVEERTRLAERLLCNHVVQRWHHDALPPSFVDADAAVDLTVELVPICAASTDELDAINRGRGLALDPEELVVIRDHFRSEGRDPTDIELETLAQTWSEHCAHKTFRAAIHDGSAMRPPLLAQLRAATDVIDAPFVRSSFVGNAGIVQFDERHTIAVKAETHNHPSAIEPFGGANTGVGGVIRDVIGAAHHPIAITDILCFGPTDLPPDRVPPGTLHPRLIESGVVAGVADYGNKIGLPTIAGAVLYDEGYVANPLVYAGCIGVAAADRNSLDGPHPGDLVVCLGGGTGRDGLRGATFSSATMDATTGDVAGASVQIGDPIVEKLLIDLLAETHGLLTAITDCGAGGLSSAVGEMAEHTGADVDLAHVTLKYPGLRPWEIWLSEAQERMVVAIDPARWPALQAACRRHGVDAASIGRFTGDGRLRVRYGDVLVLDLATSFLHDGRPQRQMHATLPCPDRSTHVVPSTTNPGATLTALLSHPNIVSKERVIRRYDHEIRGSMIVRPLVGRHDDGHGDGVVVAEPEHAGGLAVGIGVNPWFGLADPERMAHAVIDEAIRNVVAVGGDPDQVALLDNFSWGDPRRPATLGELVAAVQGCCDASIVHRAPFVSGKDSLNNEYLGSDGERHAVPPTLVITAVAAVPDVSRTVDAALRTPGSMLVLVGRTAAEFGGSHLHLVAGSSGGPVPAPDGDAPARYRALYRAIGNGLVEACHDIAEGGLAVAIAEMCIAGRLGADVSDLGHDDPTVGLFAESNGRLVCEIRPDNVTAFRSLVPDTTILGTVTAGPTVRIGPIELGLETLVAAFGAGA